MKINCNTVRVRGRRPTVYDAPEIHVECGKPAVILILTDWQEGILTADPVCAEHAAEEAFEARTSMDEDEFVIVNLDDTEPKRIIRESLDDSFEWFQWNDDERDVLSMWARAGVTS